jgi:hypothetical protein
VADDLAADHRRDALLACHAPTVSAPPADRAHGNARSSRDRRRHRILGLNIVVNVAIHVMHPSPAEVGVPNKLVSAASFAALAALAGISILEALIGGIVALPVRYLQTRTAHWVSIDSATMERSKRLSSASCTSGLRCGRRPFRRPTEATRPPSTRMIRSC